MAAAKAARRNNFMHELHLPNDPFQDPLIGRRTGVPLNINARKDSHGFDNIDDYFPDSDLEEENVVPNAQSSDKDLLVGRKVVNVSLIQDSEGFENVDDDCPETGATKSKESSAPGEVESADTPEGTLDESPNDTGTAIKIPASREPTPQFREQIKKRLAFTNGKSPIESEDDQVQTRNSPRQKSTEPISEQAEESDTEIDIVAVSDDESQLVGQQTSDRSPAVKSAIKTKEKAKKQPATHARKTKNCISMADQDDEVIDIEEIEDETFLTIGGNTTRMTKSVLDKSPVPTRVESFIMSESFVLEGTRHKSMSPEFGSSSDSQAEPEPKANKSKIPVRQKGLPNTKPVQQRATRGRKKWVEEELQKVESEVVQADERATRGRKKWVEEESQTVESEVVQADERATRGRKKRVENESQNVEPEVAQADEKDDEERGSPSSKQEQNKPVRRRKQQVEKAVELETVEVQNSGPEIKYIRKARSLPGTKQQQQQQQEKSTRRARKRDGKTRSVTSDEEEVDDDDKVDSASTAHEEKQGRGRKSMPNATQQLKKVPRGKKQKRDEEIVEYEAVEGNNEDSDVEKPPSRKTRTKKGVEGRKKAEESESVEERSEKADGGNPTEVSGRKTRAQRKKKNDAKLDRKDARERDIDGKGKGKEIEVIVDELEIENVESENVESEETGQETEESGKDAKVSKVKRKEKPGKGKENNEANLKEVSGVNRKEKPNKVKEDNELENEANLKQVNSKRGRKKSQGVVKDQELEQTEGQDLLEAVDVVSKVRGRGRGRKSQAKGGQKQGEEHQEESNAQDIVEELPEGQTSSNENIDASVSNSIVSSIASSSPESTKMIGSGVKTKRRKRSKIMPPYKYAASRRASKANSSKISITTNSHDSTTESELRVDAKKPRLQEEANETDITEKSSKKRTTTIPRKSGRAKRSGRTSEGETVTESLAQGSETESSKDGRDMSGAAMQNSDDDEINDVDSAAVDGVEDSFEATPRGTSTTAQGQPVAALKSILKSGGSVGRTSTVSRKRQITANKSHSGGSDADDESVLPAKQPNRKRLSTVSFASTPLVQESPAVPANLSSTGLSFVSKDSSFRSTDGTFTPGSGDRTVRLSVGSASSSSAGESVIDPEGEVTITNDARQIEDTSDEQNTRRSKRTIIPPLQYWKNERIDYERRKSGGWCIKGVIKNATPTPKKRRKPKQNKKPVERKENSVNAEDSSEEELDNQDLEDFQEITNPTATVFNPENDEQVDMDIFHAPGMLKFTNPSGKPAQEDDPLIVHKFISQPLFGGGQVVLRPGTEKGRQFVRNDTMVFYVTKGRVMVTVHKSSAVLHTGSTFFVPQGNSYNIKNLRNTDAKLMFVQIKG